MATAPLLMLIVAALPRADVLPVPTTEVATPVVVPGATQHGTFALRVLGSQPDDPLQTDSGSSQPALATRAESKRPARVPVVEVTVLTPAPRVAPALAPRIEPREARGPPATTV